MYSQNIKEEISIIMWMMCYEVYSNEITNKHANSISLSIFVMSQGC